MSAFAPFVSRCRTSPTGHKWPDLLVQPDMQSARIRLNGPLHHQADAGASHDLRRGRRKRSRVESATHWFPSIGLDTTALR
jgi:hypothetical protein